MKYLIYDLEIRNAIPNKGEPLVDGVSYCSGWGDYTGMGIACLVAYVSWKDEFVTILEDGMSALDPLFDETDLIVGYNNERFDNKVLTAHFGRVGTKEWRDLLDRKTYDVFQEFLFAAHNGRPTKGYKLAEVCPANGGPEKLLDSVNAPINWQRGLYDTVIEGCKHDVVMTKHLFDLIRKDGVLFSTVKKELIPLRRPAPVPPPNAPLEDVPQ